MDDNQNISLHERVIQTVRRLWFPLRVITAALRRDATTAPSGDPHGADVSSSQEASGPHPPASTNDTTVNASGQGGTDTPQQSHDAGRMPQDSAAAQEFKSDDQNDVWGFLDDVIAGKHEQLLREMNQTRLTRESEDKKLDDRGYSNKTDVDMDTSLEEPLFPLRSGVEEDQKTSGHMATGADATHTPRPKRGAASSAARSLKDYELIAYLGKGTFAEVTLARHRTTRKLFALKKISKQKVREAGFVQNTFAERQLLEFFTHPFLVKLHQAFQSSTYLYLVLDFAQGGDMYFFLESKPWIQDMRRKLQRERRCCFSSETRELMASKDYDESEGPVSHSRTTTMSLPIFSVNETGMRLAPDDSRMPLRLVAFYAIELALVLQHLHKHGFVYRDLKPENVLMMRDGHVVLTDFGVTAYRGDNSEARAAGNDGARGFTGTVQYMSPEMLLGQPHDYRIDWWSFGCLLFEMATGRRLFQSHSQYNVVKAIVESDVEILPEDFAPMEMEVELRVVRLHSHRQRFTRRILQQIARRQKKEGTSEEKEVAFCGYLSEERLSRLATSSLQQTDEISVDDHDAGSYVRQTSAGSEIFMRTNSGAFSSWSSFSSEECALYTQHAMEEINEAYRHLKDLILSLLERRVERRLCGKEVLNHPFFSCAYVVSQLYEKRQTKAFSLESLDACTPRSVSGIMPVNSPCTPSISNDLFPLMAQQNVSPSSACTMLGRNADIKSFLDDANDPNEDDDAGANLDVAELRKRLSVAFFLELPPPQRPQNWRKLFLEGKVQALYIPRLLASDDLRYFPEAVTATGDSVLTQQRVLEEKLRCFNSHSFLCEGQDEDPLYFATKLGTRSEALRPQSEFNEEGQVATTDKAVVDSILCSTLLGKKQGSLSFEKDPSFAETDDHRILSDRQDSEGLFVARYSESPSACRAAARLPKDREKGLRGTAPNPPATQGSVLRKAEGPRCGSKVTLLDAPDVCTLATATATRDETRRMEQPGSRLNPTVSVLDIPASQENSTSLSFSALSTERSLSSRLPLIVRTASKGGVRRHSVSGGVNKMSDPSHSAMCQTASNTVEDEEEEEEEETLQTDSFFPFTLPITLHGVAYDVDDYIPNTSKRRGLVLSSCTGIPQRGQSEGTSGTSGWRSARHAPAPCKRSDVKQAAIPVPNSPKNEVRLRLCEAPQEKPTALATTLSSREGAGNDVEGRKSDQEFQSDSTFSVRPSNARATTIASTLPGNVRSSGSLDLGRSGCLLPSFNAEEEFMMMNDGAEESQVSRNFGGSSTVERGGGVHHYLGFTYNEANGSAFLLGGSEVSGGCNYGVSH